LCNFNYFGSGGLSSGGWREDWQPCSRGKQEHLVVTGQDNDERPQLILE